LATSSLVQACELGGWGGLECSLRERRGETSYCDGSVVMHQTFYERTSDDERCGDGIRRVKDCAEGGHDCAGGRCVLVGVACPPAAEGVCLEGAAHACVDGRVAAEGASCGEKGLSCFEVTNGSETDAVCAIEPTPCATPGTTSECRGARVVNCAEGYPISELRCDDGETCVMAPPPPSGDEASQPEPPTTAVATAQCGLAKPCPDPGAVFCQGDKIYSCEDGAAPRREQDCGAFGDTCLVESGRAFCVTPGAPAPGVWRPLAGGTFAMGPSGGPTQPVTLGDFVMLETEVSVRSYEACVAAQACTPRDVEGCETVGLGSLDLFGDVPATCVAYDQALAYCAFVGGTLPSEAEWEYALRNGGAEQEFPWGSEPAGCDLAILSDPWGLIYWGCGRDGAWPSCSRPDGDRSAQGVCDLVGNVEEWVTRADPAPVAGVRGASFTAEGVDSLRAPSATTGPGPLPWRGFRCVRRR
ncbi:MAG TPA: SUMF1/EgtB/PvdO family nonheme iron enzyme, partial [Polyangiaceae bacterium]|nr:SUMF1/EgtB/PvdO family nonheme iron enzyme [Polyangiaceae bacterium]